MSNATSREEQLPGFPLDQSNRLRRLTLLLTLVSLVAVFYWIESIGLSEIIIDGAALRSLLENAGTWGPISIVGLMILAIMFSPIPSAPIALAAGALYGHTWGTFYVVAGATIGATGAFWVARLLGYRVMQRFLGKQLTLGWLGSQNGLMTAVLVSRLIPFISFDLVSYAAGLTPIQAWRFTLATLIGLIPVSFLLAHFGGELSESSLDQALPTLLLLGGLTLLPIVLKRLLK